MKHPLRRIAAVGIVLIVSMAGIVGVSTSASATVHPGPAPHQLADGQPGDVGPIPNNASDPWHIPYPMYTDCSRYVIGHDNNLTGFAANDDQAWGQMWSGGWRPINGPYNFSYLGIVNLAWSTGVSTPPDPPDTLSAARIEIKTPSGYISPGPWWAIPAFNAIDWNQKWLLSVNQWSESAGNYWRIQVDGPSDDAHWDAVRCG